MYLLSVPSVSSRYFNKIKRTSYLGKIARLIARNSLILPHWSKAILLGRRQLYAVPSRSPVKIANLVLVLPT